MATNNMEKKKGGLFARFRKKTTAKDLPTPAKAPPAPISSSPTRIAPAPVSAPLPSLPPRLDSPKSLRKEAVKSSWLCRTKYFRKMCDQAFDVIDTDGSGSVDEKELYSGLLLIHLKLGLYAGPAACRPIGRERCSTVFHKMDFDGSGSLDKEEFREVMTVLFSNVILRVLAQWSLTLIIVPLVAKEVLNFIYYCISSLYWVITNLDEYSTTANRIELTIESLIESFVGLIPDSLLMVWSEAGSMLEVIPESVWNTVPLTLISTILGVLVVPLIIFKIDDGFQYLADRNAEKKAKKTK